MGYVYVQVYQGPKEAPGSSFIPRFLSPANPFLSCPTAAPQHTLTQALLFQSLLILNAHLTAEDLEIHVLPEQSLDFSPALSSYTDPSVGTPFGVSESLGCPFSCCPSVCQNAWDPTPLCLLTWASVSASTGAALQLSFLSLPSSTFIHSLLVCLRRKRIVLGFEAQLLLDKPKNTGNVTLTSADAALTSAVPHVISGDRPEGCPHC